MRLVTPKKNYARPGQRRWFVWAVSPTPPGSKAGGTTRCDPPAAGAMRRRSSRKRSGCGLYLVGSAALGYAVSLSKDVFARRPGVGKVGEPVSAGTAR